MKLKNARHEFLKFFISFTAAWPFLVSLRKNTCLQTYFNLTVLNFNQIIAPLATVNNCIFSKKSKNILK